MDNASFIIQQLINALFLGSIFALIALAARTTMQR